MCSDVSAELMVSSSENLVFCASKCICSCRCLWHLLAVDIGKNPTLLDLYLLKRGKFLLKHLPLFFTEKKSTVFYWIETSVSAACWLTSWIHGYIPVSLFLHGTASSEEKIFNLKTVFVVTIKLLPHSCPFKSPSAWYFTPVYINRISGEGG